MMIVIASNTVFSIRVFAMFSEGPYPYIDMLHIFIRVFAMFSEGPCQLHSI